MKPGGRAYRFTAFLFRRVFFRIRVEGEENEPARGPVLLCANHISDADPILLSAATKRLARFMAKKELFSIPLLRRIIRSFGAFPVNRGQADPASLKRCLALLAEGEMVGIFPQGTRYPGVPIEKTPVKGGLGMLALRSRAVILPVLIQAKRGRVRVFSRITIRFGTPLRAEEYRPGEPCVSEYTRISALAFARICALAGRDFPVPGADGADAADGAGADDASGPHTAPPSDRPGADPGETPADGGACADDSRNIHVASGTHAAPPSDRPGADSARPGGDAPC